MENNRKGRCWNCGNFNYYYTKGYIRFNKEDIGFCRVEKKIIKAGGTCGKWQGDARDGVRGGISLKRISEAANEMLSLVQIIKEEQILPDGLILSDKDERQIEEIEIY